MDESDQSALIDAVVQVSFAVTAELTRVAAAHGLSLTQMRLLAILRDRRPTMSELAARLGLDRSSVSGLIDRAAVRDLVRRVPSEVDRRSHRVELTAGGQRLATEMAQQIAGQVRALTADMPAAKQVLLNELLRATSVSVD